MFIHEGKKIKIPKFLLKESTFLTKDSCINTTNKHIYLIIENTYEELQECIFDYIEDLSLDELNELIYLFKTYELKKYTRLLVSAMANKILYLPAWPYLSMLSNDKKNNID